MPRGTDRPWDRGERDRDDDDDDDRPRRRRRDDDDDDDDRPRSRRRDDDDDDRPRRRRRGDDDDYDDRPRRRGAPKKSSAGLIVGIILGVLVCGGLGLGVGGYFVYQAMGAAKARQRESNNLKQIGLAMHNQHDANGRVIGPYAEAKWGAKTPAELSWRVGLLPYIEQDNLYKQFDLNEAWDSPRNRKLSDTPIATYTTPFDETRASTKTPYRVFVSPARRFPGDPPQAMFTDDGQGVKIVAIPDGTSNTIMAAHAAEQVPWAEPRELKYDPNGPLPKLGHPNAKGVYTVLMADGSVRLISSSVSEKTLRALITRDGAEVVGDDW